MVLPRPPHGFEAVDQETDAHRLVDYLDAQTSDPFHQAVTQQVPQPAQRHDPEQLDRPSPARAGQGARPYRHARCPHGQPLHRLRGTTFFPTSGTKP
jgi:hypothetical protein